MSAISQTWTTKYLNELERTIPYTELTNEMIGAMHHDEKRLGCQAPDLEPRHIKCRFNDRVDLKTD